MKFPTNNLPTDSRYWAREVEKSITNLTSSFKSAEINNTTRDSQLLVTANSALKAATDAQSAAAQAQAAADAANQALADAAAAQADADTAQNTAIAANATATSAAQEAADAALAAANAAQDAADANGAVASLALEVATVAQTAAGAAQDAADAALVAAGAAQDAADAAQLASDANADAIAALQGLGSLDEANSEYKINASNVTVGSLNANLITTGTLDANVVNVTNLNASEIKSGSLSADRISGGNIIGVNNITAGETIFATVNLGAGQNISASNNIIATNNIKGGSLESVTSITGGSLSISGDSTLSGRILGSTGTYNATTTSTANLFVAQNGNFARSTSSRRYKSDIQSIDYGMTALQLQPRTWVDKSEYEANGNSTEGLERIPGFIAEELHDLGLTELVQYNEDGQPDAVYYDRMLVAVIPVIKNQQQLIEQLTARIEALESR